MRKGRTTPVEVRTKFRDATVQSIARQVLDLSHAGLHNRGILDRVGDNETQYLETLEHIVNEGKTPAEGLLDRYHGEWNGDIERVFKEVSY